MGSRTWIPYYKKSHLLIRIPSPTPSVTHPSPNLSGHPFIHIGVTDQQVKAAPQFPDSTTVYVRIANAEGAEVIAMMLGARFAARNGIETMEL
ncbi:hypothetical protein ACH5RR_006368 [Cinchona calisaya]|uniref:Uncharacterized protein n=1 Tax=Cinchona calisaya TaxID=153742 RepID=A0ABD3ANT1_9GENT